MELNEVFKELWEKKLNFKQKKSFLSKVYAFPRLKKLPLNDAAHVRNAMARFNQTQGMTSEERKTAIRKILRAAKKFGVKTDQFLKKYGKK